jgi:hypothetical protein
LIPPDGVTEVFSYESSQDAEYRRQDEPRWFVVAGHDELSDNTSDEPNDDCPNNAHGLHYFNALSPGSAESRHVAVSSFGTSSGWRTSNC